MKKVVILFGKSEWKKSRPFSNKEYMYSYEFFYDICKKSGIEMYRASYEWYDYEKNIFKYAWIFEGKNANWKRVKNIRPDLVYDKTVARLEVYHKKEMIGRSYPFINDLEFTQIIDNKFVTGLIFEKWSKPSWLAKDKRDLARILPRIKTKKVVMKPLSSSGGKGIQILEKEKALRKAVLDQNYLVQDFIDSSAGVPGVSHTLHDLRLVFVNDKLIYAYIREPKKGSYLANLAQGGNLKIVPREKIPNTVAPIIKYANNIFGTFEPRVYSIDFMFDRKKKPWVVELNSMPGLFFTPEEKSSMMMMYKELLKIFMLKLSRH